MIIIIVHNSCLLFLCFSWHFLSLMACLGSESMDYLDCMITTWLMALVSYLPLLTSVESHTLCLITIYRYLILTILSSMSFLEVSTLSLYLEIVSLISSPLYLSFLSFSTILMFLDLFLSVLDCNSSSLIKYLMMKKLLKAKNFLKNVII